MMQNAASIFAVPNIPDIREGDDLARIIGDCLEDQDIPLADGDILCIAHKIFSKAEGNTYWLKDVEASAEAAQLGEELNKDPRKCLGAFFQREKAGAVLRPLQGQFLAQQVEVPRRYGFLL